MIITANSFTLPKDDVQTSEWRVIFRNGVVSIRPDMQMAEGDGLRPWEVGIAPERIWEFIDGLSDMAEALGYPEPDGE